MISGEIICEENEKFSRENHKIKTNKNPLLKGIMEETKREHGVSASQEIDQRE